MSTDADDDVNASPAKADRPGEVVRARAERLDRIQPSEANQPDNPSRGNEVAALNKQLQGYQRTVIIAVPVIVILIITLIVVIFMSAPYTLPAGSGSQTVTATVSADTTTPTPSSSMRPSSAPTTTVASTVASTTAPVTSSTPLRIPAPPVYLNGQFELYTDSEFDLDSGSHYVSGDIIHDGQAISGNGGATLAHGIPDIDEYNSCAAVPLTDYRSHIRFSEFIENRVLCVRTDEGRLAFLELTGFPDSNGGNQMAFRWTTWRK